MNSITLRGLRAATHSPFPSAKYTHSLFQASQTPFQLRNAFSAHSPALKYDPPPPQSSLSVNGPLTTLPAPLELPKRAPDQSLFSFAFKAGKTYLAFYKTGVKNIYTNYQLSKKVKARLNSSKITIKDAVQTSKITRSEFLLLHRNNHDIKRVPIFALVLLICGEFTPLVIMAVSWVVPWTCRIPKQVDGDRTKIEKRREASFVELALNAPTLRPSVANDIEATIKGLESWEIRHINWTCGLSLQLWEWVFGPPEMLLRRRVRRHMEYLDLDDRLIAQAGGWHDVSKEEVRMACAQRGLDVMGVHEAELRRNLDAWLKNKDVVGMEKLLDKRPKFWQVKPSERSERPKHKHNQSRK